MAAMADVVYFRTTHSQTSQPKACFLMAKCKIAPIKQTSVPKMELEAAVIGLRLLQLIQREMTLNFSQIFPWSDSQVVLDWTKREANRFCFKQIARNTESLLAEAMA